jgi:hypothetical protein
LSLSKVKVDRSLIRQGLGGTGDVTEGRRDTVVVLVILLVGVRKDEDVPLQNCRLVLVVVDSSLLLQFRTFDMEDCLLMVYYTLD